MEHLERLTPREKVFALFRAVVLDTWEERKRSVSSELTALKEQITKLESDRQKVEHAFLFDLSLIHI